MCKFYRDGDHFDLHPKKIKNKQKIDGLFIWKGEILECKGQISVYAITHVSNKFWCARNVSCFGG